MKDIGMITIIDATSEHIPVIHQLAARIWPTAFHHILTDKQIAYMLDRMYSIPSLQQQVKNGHHFLLAKEDKRYLGYASYEIKEEENTARLHKIYILPATQGKGIGKQLMQEVISRAKDKKQESLQLNVNRFNNAVEFYKRLGFQIIRKEDNDIGNGFFMNDFVMELIV